MRLDSAEARRRFASRPVARLATAGPDGRPHLVPFTFALAAGEGDPGPGDRLYSAVDAKPKSSPDLRRLRNIRADPQVCVLADHYEDDWDRLWWARADGHATILEDPAAMALALELLARRYPRYREQAPGGPVISIRVARWTGWAAATGPQAGAPGRLRLRHRWKLLASSGTAIHNTQPYLVAKNTGIDSPKPSVMAQDCQARPVSAGDGMSGAWRWEAMYRSMMIMIADPSDCTSA